MTYAFDCDVFVKPVYTLMTSRQSTSNKGTDKTTKYIGNKTKEATNKLGDGGAVGWGTTHYGLIAT